MADATETSGFFDSSLFMPHGHCFLWEPGILWLHVLADSLIALSYYSIPLGLLYFARKRQDLPFRGLFSLFSTFILLCGTTHLFAIWTLWYPDYAAEGIIKAVTALVSAFTAFMVWRLMPQAVKLPGPRDLKVMNERLALTNTQIEQKVQERTYELQQSNRRLMAEIEERERINLLLKESERRLHEAVRSAEAANQAKSEFLANMSHEIRTPMNAVVGLTHILSGTNPLTDKQQKCVDTLRVSADALLELLNDLLDISKIENEQFELEHIAFDLDHLLQEAMTVAAVRGREKHLKLDVQRRTTIPALLIGDRARVRQVLVNLLTNAVKFTDQGSVTLSIACEPQIDSRAVKIVIEVEDTGAGIPTDKLEVIFDKFTQGHMLNSQRSGGTGLGLAISRNLARKMQGDVTARNRSDRQGACFTFTMVLDQLESDRSQPAGELRVATPEDRDKPLVLIVEDWKPNVLVVSMLLDELGYRYDVAYDGAQALDMIAQKTYDGVLMDIQMPGMDGYEAVRRLREIESENGTHLPVIATTAYALSNDREKCLKAGMDDYVSKPIDVNELSEKLERLVRNPAKAA